MKSWSEHLRHEATRRSNLKCKFPNHGLCLISANIDVSLRNSRPRLDRPAPLPADLARPLASKTRASSSFGDLRTLPSVVQDDLISLLRDRAHSEDSTIQEKANALHDLAMCIFGGVQASNASLEKGMQLLVDAAEHGSQESLLLAFRLHEALYRTVPERLLVNPHPLAVLQRERLANKKPDSYMSQRILEVEELYQRKAVQCIFDTFHEDAYLFSCCLPDVLEKLAHSDIRFGPEDLYCQSKTNIIDSSPPKGNLLHWAARLNLQSLVEYLVSPRPNGGGSYFSLGDGSTDRRLLSGEVLSAACEGGHLTMLRWLTQQDFLFTFTGNSVLFHWLTKFPSEDIAAAMDIILVLQGTTKKLEYVSFDKNGGPGTRQRIFPGPTDDLLASHKSIELAGAQLQGTALEFAIETNNKPLVGLFLSLISMIGSKDPLRAVGWTEKTFDIAVSLNLWNLVPVLAAVEKTFQRTTPAKETEARYRESEGREPLLPFGLSGFGMPYDPMLPFLIHGAEYAEAMEKTLDIVLSEGLCDINDLNERGDTPLSNFLQFGHCDFTTNIVQHLISRGARIAQSERQDVSKILKVIAKTRSHRTSAELIRALVEVEVLANEGNLLAIVIQWGNLDAVRMLFGLDSNSHRLRANLALAELPEDLRASALEKAIHAKTNNAQMVKLLLSLGADVNSRPGGFVDGGKWPTSPLERATELFSCDADIIDALFNAGAEPSSHGITVLGWAALQANCWVDGEPVMRYLLRYEEIRNLKDVEFPGYGSPLLVACHAGNVDAAFALLDAGADCGDDNNVEFLCEIAASVARDPTELPPGRGENDLTNRKLVYRWRCQIAKLLRVLRAERQLIHGRTALHFAVETLNFERIIEIVNEDSSLVSICDDHGRLPVHVLEDADALEMKSISESPYLPHIKRVKEFLDKSLAQGSGDVKPAPSVKLPEGSAAKRRAVVLRESKVLGMASEVVMLPGRPLILFAGRKKGGDGPISRYGSYPIYDINPSKSGVQRCILMIQHVQATIEEFGENTEDHFLAKVRLADHLSWMQQPDAHGALQYAEDLATRCSCVLGPEHRLNVTCDIVISRALYNSHQNDKAIAMQKRVISSLQQTAGANHVQTRANTNLLCLYLRDAKQVAEAERISQQCLDLLRNSGEAEGADTVEAYLLIGECKIERGRFELHQANCDPSEVGLIFEDAVTALNTAVDLARQHFGGKSHSVYTCLFHLATAHALLGRDDQARALFTTIVRETRDQTEKEAIQLVVNTQQTMWRFGLDRRDLAEQISDQESLLQTMNAYADHYSANAIRDTMTELAKLYDRAGRVHDALHLVQQSLAWRVRNLGASHADTIATKFQASKLLQAMRKYSDAERLQREILDTYDQIARESKVPVDFHDRRRTLVQSIARLCFDQMKFRESERMTKQTLQTPGGAPLHGSSDWVQISLSFATTLAVHGDGDQAERLSREVLQVCLEGGEPGLEETVPRAFANLTFILQKRGKHGEAASCALEAVRRDPRSARARLDLMTARLSCGSSNGARLAGKAAMKLLQTQNDPSTTGHGLYFTYFSLLASDFLRLGDHEQAKVASDEALLRFEQLDGPGKSSRLARKLDVLRNLKTALELAGEEARVYQVSKEILSLETQDLAGPMSQIQTDQLEHLTGRAYEASQHGLEAGIALMKTESPGRVEEPHL